MDTPGNQVFYVSTLGNDEWSGKLADPTANGTDGPFATITRARDVIRESKRHGGLTGSVTVYIRGGRYPISEPITFAPEDSAPATYVAYPGEEPIIDGGVHITGWHVTYLGGREVWAAPLLGTAAGMGRFRQLFVNGKRCQRSRLPKDDYFRMADVPGTSVDVLGFGGSDTFRCSPGDVLPWRNITDMDVVVPHYWVTERMPVTSFDPDTNTVVCSRKSFFSLKDDTPGEWARYWVENIFEALSEPGEWYWDRDEGQVYYLPRPDERIEDIEAYAPRTEQLLKLTGQHEEGRHIEFLRFEGLTFEHGGWSQPPSHYERWGVPDNVEYGTAPQAAFDVPGAIQMVGARYCTIEDCRIRHVGLYGVGLGDGCSGIRLVGNEICDLGAGGINLGNKDALPPLSKQTGNNVITDNHLYDGGHVFHEGVGILALHTFGNQIAHNHIHDFFYSGISCGWEWAYRDSISKDNVIEKNYIHHLGKGFLSDMGGIYTLGVQPGTVLRGNVIHDVSRRTYGGWAIYPDEGSSHILIEYNICYDTQSTSFFQHYGRENIVRNNIFAFGGEAQVGHGRMYGRPGGYRVKLEEPRKAFLFERNIVITDGQPIFQGGSGAPLERCGFASDLNLFWDVSGKGITSVNLTPGSQGGTAPVFGWEEWRQLGQDRHSIIADPQFRDLAHRDFTLRPGSPAEEIGFQPIDTSDVGPRPKGQRDD